MTVVLNAVAELRAESLNSGEVSRMQVAIRADEDLRDDFEAVAEAVNDALGPEGVRPIDIDGIDGDEEPTGDGGTWTDDIDEDEEPTGIEIQDDADWLIDLTEDHR